MLTLGVLLAGLLVRFDLVQMLALYGFRLDLPQLATPTAVFYVATVIASFVGLSISIVWNLSDGGQQPHCAALCVDGRVLRR